MVIRPDLLDGWPEVQAHLPADFDLDRTARACGAFARAREVKDAVSLLRLALAYGGCGMSLRETCVWAEAAGIASLSDPSLIERLCKAAPWLGDIVAALISEQAKAPAGRWAGYRLRALDTTAICEPGADRTTWRLHVGYDLATGQADQIELTDGRGAENLQRFAYRPDDIVLADRGYARSRDLRPVIQAGAHFIVRTGWNSVRLLQPDGRAFDLFATLDTQVEQEGEVTVRVNEGADVVEPVAAAPHGPGARAHSRRKLSRNACRKNAKKRGTKLDPRTLEAAKYILLLTSLPAASFPTADVLALYRFRWQLELAFKRMKSLAGLQPTGGQEAGPRTSLALRQTDCLLDRRTERRASPGTIPLRNPQSKAQAHRAGASPRSPSPASSPPFEDPYDGQTSATPSRAFADISVSPLVSAENNAIF